MGHDDWKDDPKYIAEQKEFHAKLARRDALKQIIEKKYPEVMELLSTYYQEKHWY